MEMYARFSMNIRTMQEEFYLASERAQFTIRIDVLQTKQKYAVQRFVCFTSFLIDFRVFFFNLEV